MNVKELWNTAMNLLEGLFKSFGKNVSEDLDPEMDGSSGQKFAVAAYVFQHV